MIPPILSILSTSVVILVIVAILISATVAGLYFFGYLPPPALRKQGRGLAPFFPYVRTSALLTPTELAFFAALRSIGLPALICPKVRIADLLAVSASANLTDSAYRSALSRIAQKHVDFVLADPVSSVPILAIEIDDKSHRQARRAERDSFVDGAFLTAKLPLVRIAAASRYSARDIQARLQSAFATTTAPR